MAYISDLVDKLSAIDLSSPSTVTSTRRPLGHWHNDHVLLFDFPSLSLLPEGVTEPFIHAPANVAWRDEPPNDKAEVGLLDNDFSVMLPSDGTYTPPHHFSPNVGEMVTQVQILTNHPGTSKLSGVCFHHPTTGRLVYRFAVTTNTGTGFSPIKHGEFELDGDEYDTMQTNGSHIEWVRMLRHLVLRCSDRAYYHVRSRLQVHAARGSADEAVYWGAAWNSIPLRTLRELFQARMLPTPNVDANSPKRPNFEPVHTVRLPCCPSRLTNITQSHIDNMTVNTLATATCPTCDAAILQPIDYQELQFRTEVHRRREHIDGVAAWKQLAACVEHDTPAQTFGPTAILIALTVAAQSMRDACLVSPPEMSFVRLPETKRAIQTLEQFFHNRPDEVLTMGPRPMFWLLMDHVLDTEAEFIEKTIDQYGWKLGVSPGFEALMEEWLRRVVGFLVGRRCKVMQGCHQGVHKHGNRLFYNLDVKGTVCVDGGEGDESEKVTTMAELLGMMEETKLE